jgi:hypothetical protein
MTRADRFWCLLFLLTLTLSLAERLLAARTRYGEVIILDPAGSVLHARLLPFRDAHALHVQQATLATHAFLNRTPLDFDHPELLQLMFLEEALTRAKAQFAEEGTERAAKQLHQKAEIARLDVLETRAQVLVVLVTGQLVRSGSFQGQTFAESLPFSLRLRLRRNPNLAFNGRFPLAVERFTYDTELRSPKLERFTQAP